MKLWCYEDAHYWGKNLFEEGQRRNWDVHLFEGARQPDTGVLFMHMHAHPAVRNHHKRLMQHFATKPQLQLWPDYRAAMLYDDKLEQLRQLAKWMPPTLLLKSPLAAREFIDSRPTLPIMSKSGEGSGVRMLRTYDDCLREIKLAFSDLGIRNRHGALSHGYLYWQQHVGTTDSVIRAICIGNERLFLKRGPRVKTERQLTPVTTMTDEVVGAFAQADRIIKAEGFKFCGLDLIEHEGRWLLLKLIVGWSARKYFDCTIIPDGRPGTKVWEVLADQIEQRAIVHG